MAYAETSPASELLAKHTLERPLKTATVTSSIYPYGPHLLRLQSDRSKPNPISGNDCHQFKVFINTQSGFQPIDSFSWTFELESTWRLKKRLFWIQGICWFISENKSLSKWRTTTFSWMSWSRAAAHSHRTNRSFPQLTASPSDPPTSQDFEIEKTSPALVLFANGTSWIQVKARAKALFS